MAFLMTIVFGIGLYYHNALKKIEAQIAAGPSIADWDAKLSKRIGSTYDRKLNDQMVMVLDSEQKTVVGLLKASNSFSQVVLRVAGVSTLFALGTVFLLVRKSHQLQGTPPTPVEPPSPDL